MTDLTAITTPFGLLDEVYGPGTQEALKAHGGPWECFAVADGLGWKDGTSWNNDMENFPALTWRVKPAPPKPREWWIDPERFIATDLYHAGFVHVREVLPE